MKSMVLSLGVLVASGVAIAATAVSATAATFSVSNITGNNAANALTGETQLQIDLTDALGGENGAATQAVFKFSNVGPNLSSITQIYFDQNDSNPLLASISSIMNGTGTNFEVPRNVGNLPGGNPINFDEDFSIEPSSRGGTQPNGVNPGEHVSVLFNLNSGKTFADVLAAMKNDVLRVGFHVQGYSNGGSEAFVSRWANPETIPTPPPVVQPPSNSDPEEPPVVEDRPSEPESIPEPGMVLGLAVVGGAMRYARQRSAKAC